MNSGDNQENQTLITNLRIGDYLGKPKNNNEYIIFYTISCLEKDTHPDFMRPEFFAKLPREHKVFQPRKSKNYYYVTNEALSLFFIIMSRDILALDVIRQKVEFEKL